ncbi:hypothetical protein H7X68_02570 [Candidatus Saccharibacteria bacterium]|nr:hypothetical protein [Candidatus Saccharibacteria bacterium]
MNTTQVREVRTLLDTASVRLKADGILLRAIERNSFEDALERLKDLKSYMKNEKVFSLLDDATRDKSRDAKGLLDRNGYIS